MRHWNNDTKYPGVVEESEFFLATATIHNAATAFPLFFDAPNVRDYIHSKSVTFSTAKFRFPRRPVSPPCLMATNPEEVQ